MSGHRGQSFRQRDLFAAQLKTIQEVTTLLVFAGFSVAYLRAPLTWNYAIGFAFFALGAYFVFAGPFGHS